MMDEANVKRSYSIVTKSKTFVNNEKLSDVVFLVGDEKKKVYGHKMMLAFGSSVFEKMLFGDLKMDETKPIEIPDLTPVGFINMLKYIYGNEIERCFNWQELFETFMSANKYLVHEMIDDLTKCINKYVNRSNCFTIYSQLIRIPIENVIALNQVRKWIQINIKTAMNSKSFSAIQSQATLLNLLSFENLNSKEIDILEACSRWVDEEILYRKLVANSENKQKVFDPIKKYIRFADITLEELKQFDKIKDLLSLDEIGSLFLSTIDKSQKMIIDCQTPRAKPVLHHVTGPGYSTTDLSDGKVFSEFIVSLNVNRHLLVEDIYLTLINSIKESQLSIYENKVELSLKSTLLKTSSGKWYFRFKDTFCMKPANDYKFIFKFTKITFLRGFEMLNRNIVLELKDGDQSIVNFKLKFEKCHCIKKIHFFLPPNELFNS